MESKCIVASFLEKSVTDNPVHLCLVRLYGVSADDRLWNRKSSCQHETVHALVYGKKQQQKNASQDLIVEQ